VAVRKTEALIRSVMTCVITKLIDTGSLEESKQEEVMTMLEEAGLVTTLMETLNPKRGPKATGPSQEELRQQCKDLRIQYTGNKTTLSQRLADYKAGTLAAREPTTAELKEECAANRLPISGSKVVLVQRLADYKAGTLDARASSQKELKERCQELGWPITGNKAVLQDYIERAEAGETPPTSVKGESAAALKEIAQSLGCKITGNKTVLLERIADAKIQQETAAVVDSLVTAVVTETAAEVETAEVETAEVTETAVVETAEVTETAVVETAEVAETAVVETAEVETVEEDEAEVDVEELEIAGVMHLWDAKTKIVYDSAENPVEIGTWDGSVLNAM
jgi:hypothetical protein